MTVSKVSTLNIHIQIVRTYDWTLLRKRFRGSITLVSPDRTHLMGIPHVFLQKGEGEHPVDVLSLPNAAIRALLAVGPQRALQGGHLNQALPHSYPDIGLRVFINNENFNFVKLQN